MPAQLFLNEMARHEVEINYRIESTQEFPREALAAMAVEN